LLSIYPTLFPRSAIEPPEEEAVDHVLEALQELNALTTDGKVIHTAAPTSNRSGKGGKRGVQVPQGAPQRQLVAASVEELTPLGVHLAALPVDPRIGKMMLFGAIFRCLDPVLVIAASLAFRSPFLSPMDKREEADKVKCSFHPKSDHLTLYAAFRQWQQARRLGKQAENNFLFDNFLSRQTM